MLQDLDEEEISKIQNILVILNNNLTLWCSDVVVNESWSFNVYYIMKNFTFIFLVKIY